MFQRQIFRRLFFSYITIILVCLFVFTSFILYENHIINKERMKRESEIVVDEVSSILRERFLNAQNIVMDLNYSTALKQLYFSIATGSTLNSYESMSIINELQVKQFSSKLSIDEVDIFLNTGNKAYSSSSGVINLKDTYHKPEEVMPYYKIDTVRDLFRLKSNNRYSFNKNYLIYCDSYTYQNGNAIGTISILFNVDTLKSDIKNILYDGYGTQITLNGEELLKVGSDKGTEYTGNSGSIPGITVKLYAPKDSSMKENTLLIAMLAAIGIISAAFIALAYYFSKKYYQPIDRIEHMVMNQGKGGPEDGCLPASTAYSEMDSIIREIKNLIGERNNYQEKMLTITPYAQTGMLHGMLTGNMEHDSIRILTEENYLDLIKPYFIVSIVNFAYPAPQVFPASHQQMLQDLFHKVCSIFSTDELRFVFYGRDINNVFLIANFENDEPLDELFYQIHKYIRETVAQDNCLVTMGVDDIKNDIRFLKDACEGAVRALDEMLIEGRSEVYFNDLHQGTNIDYYIPKNFTDKLLKVLKKGQSDEIRQMMQDIYQRNRSLGGTPEMYHALIDELHLAVVKAIKEITDLNTTHIRIEKYRSAATLEEMFQYYEAALDSAMKSIQLTATDQSETDQLEGEIHQFIEENYCNPDMSLQYLTDKFDVSSKYLSIFCKNHYGTTYLQYIQNKRIEKASALLKTEQYSLSQICSMCGYTNQLTFRRNFKSVTGMNPSDFNE